MTSKNLPLSALLAAALLMAGCTAPTPGAVEGRECHEGSKIPIHIDGSSTVYPIAEAWAEEFADCAGIEADVAFSGTGGGFKAFCRGEIDVADASRPIKTGAGSETETCQRAGIQPFEVQVAIDGLAVVVHKDNDFVTDLKVSELNRIWTQNASKQANTWKDVRPEWPDEAIELFGPGTNSGTFDYFVEVVITPFDGPTTVTKGRDDYTPSEDDDVLVRGVTGEENSLGYFGLAYAMHAGDDLRIIPIVRDTKDGGKTFDSAAQPVEPTPANVENGVYAPLSRPLFMYTDGAPRGELRSWLELGLSADGQAIVTEVGYVKLPEAKRTEMLAKLG